MKNSHLVSLAILIVCSYITLSSFKTSGMHPATTGAPGETTCAQPTCHSDATVTNDNNNTVNTLTFSSTDASYVPGQTYTMTLKAQRAGISKFGFGIVALRNSTTSNSGTWIITDSARTHIIDGTVSSATRYYVTHSTDGTPAVSPGLGQWSFNWTAPSTDEGNITFYYATNCTNNDDQNTGDAIWLSSFEIHPYGSSISEWINESDFNVTINSALNELVVNYKLKKECKLYIQLTDYQGKIVKKTDSSGKASGTHSDRINLGNDISSGIYFVHLTINDQTLTKKIVMP